MSISKKVQITGMTVMVVGTVLGLVPTVFPDCNTRTLRGARDNLYQAILSSEISRISSYTFLGGLMTFVVGSYL